MKAMVELLCPFTTWNLLRWMTILSLKITGQCHCAKRNYFVVRYNMLDYKMCDIWLCALIVRNEISRCDRCYKTSAPPSEHVVSPCAVSVRIALVSVTNMHAPSCSFVKCMVDTHARIGYLHAMNRVNICNMKYTIYRLQGYRVKIIGTLFVRQQPGTKTLIRIHLVTRFK